MWCWRQHRAPTNKPQPPPPQKNQSKSSFTFWTPAFVKPQRTLDLNMQDNWDTYCVSLINVHRAGDWREAFIAFCRIWCHGRGHTVCRKHSKQRLYGVARLPLHHHTPGRTVSFVYFRNEGLPSARRGWQHKTLTNRHTRPEMGLRDVPPGSSCAAEHRIWAGKAADHREQSL